MYDTALSLTGATVRLARRTVLTNASLTVAPGETVALLGPNGSGKSTLVKAALGLVPMTRGSVSFFGEHASHTPWERIGYVPQRNPAATGIPTTAMEVVRAGVVSRRLRRPASCADAMTALETVGIAALASRPVQEMSGGQQQRVLLARALVRNPDILLLDEPTTGIDVDTIASLVRTVRAMRGAGTAVLVVLHETEAFTPILDRAVVLSHGRVIHDGSPYDVAGESSHAHTHPHAPSDREPPLNLEIAGGAS